LAGHRKGAELTQPSSLAEVPSESNLAAIWLTLARKLVSESTDVGGRFAEEARKMHYGEIEQRSIRGQSTLKETKELIEEGIEVIPLLLPQLLKEPLQ